MRHAVTSDTDSATAVRRAPPGGWLRGAAVGLVGWLLPPTCVLCGAPGDAGRDLCAGCAAELPRNQPACARCALPLEPPVSVDALCGACQQQPPPFDSAFALFRYSGAVPALVLGAKFHGRLNQARLLGDCLAAGVAARAGAVDAVVPVPLHPRRLRERGYNQVLEIGRELRTRLGLSLEPGLCARILATPPQTGLDAAARQRNLRGAFVARGAVAGRRLVVLDDVMTTGATVAEVARVLKGAGAARVDVWAIARTP